MKVSKLGHTLFPRVRKELMIYLVPAHIAGVQNKAGVWCSKPSLGSRDWPGL